MDWMSGFWNAVFGAAKGWTAFAIPVLLLIVGRWLWLIGLRFHCFWTSRRRALSAVAREWTRDGPREGKGLWLTPPSPPDNYADAFGTRVLVVSNNKGGVAKTTLAANLGAYWAREWAKRVLLIDLDYQGTLSSMALGANTGWVLPGQDSIATRMVSGDLDPSILVHCAKRVPNEANLKIIPAYYDLAQADNRLIVEWLLRCNIRKKQSLLERGGDLLYGKPNSRDDIRYRLAELLQTSAVREAFDVVIIDCPPRVTISVLQALCAATHVLIPTILDRPSSEAVISFCTELETLKSEGIAPKFRYVGIVGTKVSANVDRIAELRAINAVGDALKSQGLPPVLLEKRLLMRESAAFVNNENEGIAYLVMGNGARQIQIKAAMGELADYVANQIGLPRPQR